MLAVEEYSKETNEEEKRRKEEIVNCLLSNPQVRLNIPQKVYTDVLMAVDRDWEHIQSRPASELAFEK